MRRLSLITVLLVLAGSALAQTRDFAKWVDPFIGTGGHGHTFPGATMPFGMVQLSPDTRIDNWDGSSGYHYSDDTIYGFSHTHLSGTGIPDYCDILFMPYSGFPTFDAKAGEKSINGYASKFSHANEKAEPGYYSVKLDDDGILAELTATTRVGLHRYTFPKTGNQFVIIDLRWRDKLIDSQLRLMSSTRVEGYRRSSSWAKDQNIYFVAEFSKPIKGPFMNRGTGGGDDETNKKAVFRFDDDGTPLLMKVAISPVSIEGARENLDAELPGWDFDKVRRDARAAWNKELSKIEVTGGTDSQKTTFYTALYHTMIQPNVFNDVDGQYRGLDGKVHSLRSADTPVRMSAASARNRSLAGGTGDADKSVRAPSEQYTVFSLWDTFRAAHPLYTIVDQKRTVDFINTFIRQYEQGGRLPVWELWGNETDCMIGYHSVSVIADAMAKGIKGFDYEKGYAAAKHSAELDHFGLAAYKKRGYISMEDENESVSRTLEYAYDDWCIAQMAKMLLRQKKEAAKGFSTGWSEKNEDALRRDMDNYEARARYFENLFDTRTGFFRPKKNGGFVEPFAPNEVTFGFTEGNSWQYSFFVPQDVDRLMELMGGRGKFVAKLDELFTTDQKLAGREQADLTGLIGQYAHGNEPSHHIAYLYDFAGEPWKTQKYVRQILDNFYKPTPDGLIGNEDCGQMSAWYIMSAAGIYEVTPGSGIYAFGTPLFPELKFDLENGKNFVIRGKDVSEKNFYIASAKLNGVPYKKAFISHADLMKGGVLEFEMTDKPSKEAFNEFPKSRIDLATVAVPAITAERTFAGNTTLYFSNATPDSRVHFTTNGSTPTADSEIYTSPIPIDRTTTVKAIAIDAKGRQSQQVEAALTKRPHEWTVKVLSGYSRQYTGGGENGIVDGIRGTVNFASGEWQGIQGKPYEAVIDLKKDTEISELGASFLQVAGPWIWMPADIKFDISHNGTDWTQVAAIKTDVPVTDMKPQIKEFRQAITPTRARYVRIRAFNIGKIPSWHPGAGGDPWVFIDEVFVK